MSTLTVTIAGTSYNVESFSMDSQIEKASQCDLTVCDVDDAYTFTRGQKVTVNDSVEGDIFVGRIHSSTRNHGKSAGSFVIHHIECVGLYSLMDVVTADKVYTNQYSGVIFLDLIKKLKYQGITANYALLWERSLSDFTSGIHSGCRATTYEGDGCIELALDGIDMTVSESTTADFGTGTLTNVTAASDTLAPTAKSAIKLYARESMTYDENGYVYVTIYDDGGLITIITGRYLEYNIWISSSSPDIRAGVEIVFTDGTTMRDTSLPDYRYYDNQHIRSHPGEDQSGFADGQWRARKFWLESFVGKVISHVDVVIEGNEVGEYTAYFTDILETDGAGTTINTFFNGTLNTVRQMQISGYTDIAVTVVDTYDCGTATSRVSSDTAVGQVGILKDSTVSWDATEPDETGVVVSYSLDSGNSYTTCTNGEALPNLPAGTDLTGKNISFKQAFTQTRDASPESKPILNSLTCTLNTSYSSTKTDITISACTAGEWATGTYSNTEASGGILKLEGYTREWSDGETSELTIFGGKASGTGPTTVNHHCNRGVLWTVVGVQMEGRSRLDDAGQWDDFVVDVDVYVDVTNAYPGLVYRTTGWSDYDANYAYAIEIGTDVLKLQRGSNSSASSDGTRTQVDSQSLSFTTAAWHRLTAEVSGSSHKIYVDDALIIDTTDSTYTSAGNLGTRSTNGSTTDGYQGQFHNFGVCGTGKSGTWTSASQSLSSLGTYGGSVVSWEDVSTNTQDATILVQSTVNGGSSWQTVTNGGSIQNLTVGQSLSGVSVQFKITLTTTSAACLPQVQYFVARVLGEFSSTGTRISSELDLSGADRAGDTLISWNATEPTDTSVVVATASSSSGSWTDRDSGDGIAHVTSQPALVRDSFDTNSFANYTSTSISGGGTATWSQNATTSCITGSSGSDGILYYNALNCADAYIEADLDQLSNSGLVCRMTSTSSMYVAFLYDEQGSPSTNYYILSRVTSGPTYTTISQGSTTITRGVRTKFKLSCVGTTISLYQDGAQLASVTDSGVTGAGYVGLLGDNLIRCYNLRAQGYGDDLDGVSAYSRVTLTSTDPTATPRIQTLALAAFSSKIGKGSLVTADYQQRYVSDAVKDLLKRSNYICSVPPDGEIIFNERTITPSPWYLDADDTTMVKTVVTTSADKYRNRQTLTGIDDTTTYITCNNEGQFADTISQQDYIDQASIDLYPPTILATSSSAYTSSGTSADLDVTDCSCVTIDVNVTAVSGTSPTLQIYVDRKGLDGVYHTLWTSSSITSVSKTSESIGQQCSINKDIGTTLRVGWTLGGVTPSFTMTLSMQGLLDNQAANIGIIEAVENVSALDLDLDEAETYANSRLQEYGNIGKRLRTLITRTGLEPGQSVPINDDHHGIIDTEYLVTKVSRQALNEHGDVYYEMKIEGVTGAALEDWRQAMNTTITGG
jgi:hypothetical protein